MKRPSFQFYPGDWLRSTDLRSCSIAARGLWIEMLALMHEGEPYGHLRVGKRDITAAILWRMVGALETEIKALLAELEEAKVFSRTASGIIYSRRMVRDENKRNMCASEGSKSLAHPNVRKPGYPSPHPTPPSLPPSAASAVASASASSNQKLYEKTGKKLNGICAFGDCQLHGTKTRSTTGGPWYCTPHFDEVHGTAWKSAPIETFRQQTTQQPEPAKGKFDD